jgi:hypothetical protein
MHVHVRQLILHTWVPLLEADQQVLNSLVLLLLLPQPLLPLLLLLSSSLLLRSLLLLFALLLLLSSVLLLRSLLLLSSLLLLRSLLLLFFALLPSPSLTSFSFVCFALPILRLLYLSRSLSRCSFTPLFLCLHHLVFLPLHFPLLDFFLCWCVAPPPLLLLLLLFLLPLLLLFVLLTAILSAPMIICSLEL